MRNVAQRGQDRGIDSEHSRTSAICYPYRQKNVAVVHSWSSCLDSVLSLALSVCPSTATVSTRLP